MAFLLPKPQAFSFPVLFVNKSVSYFVKKCGEQLIYISLFIFQVSIHKPNPNQSFRLAIKQSIQHSDINIASNYRKSTEVISSPNYRKIDVRKTRNAATKSELKNLPNLMKLLYKTRHTKSLRAFLKRIMMIKDQMKGYIRLH